MSATKIAGYAAIAAGAVGAYGRFSTYNANQPSSAGEVSGLANFDPALLVGIKPTGNLLDMGMILDLALVAVGVWLVMS